VVEMLVEDHVSSTTTVSMTLVSILLEGRQGQ